MTTRMTINGVSTCQTAGTEKYEKYQTTIRRKRTTLFQYDYRHTDGATFLLRETDIGGVQTPA